MGTSKSDSGHTPPTTQPTPQPMAPPPVLKPLALFEDEPIRSNNEDHLTLRPFADIVAGAAIGTRGPFTIGVFAEWGQGKTSVLRLAKERVETSDRKDNTVTVFFNAWQYDKEDHPIVPLVATILQAIEDKHRELDRAGKSDPVQKAAKAAATGFGAVTRALRAILYGFSMNAKVGLPVVGEVEASFVAKEMVDRYEDLKKGASDDPLVLRTLYFNAFQLLDEATRQAREAVAGGKGSADEAAAGPRIVVFVDDLDRCLPDRAVRLLESIKLVLCQPGFIFVMAIARRMVESHLRKRYKDDFGVENYETEGTRYLDKIVQLPLPIPSHTARFGAFVERLVESHRGLDDELKALLKSLAPLIGIGAKRTPRSAVRLLNNLLVDDRLRETAFPAGSDFQIKRVDFIGLCCVSRSLRYVLDEELYDALSDSRELCDAMGDGRGIEGLSAIRITDGREEVAIDTGPKSVGGRTAPLRDWAGKLDRVIRRLRAAEYLDELFRHDIGKEWLKDTDRRRRIDEFFAEQRDETPSSEEALSQAAIVERAIREALNLSDEAPIPPERLRRLTKLRLYGAQVGDNTLVHLKGMTNLRELSLDNTEVTDAGLAHLKGMTKLTSLSLEDAEVSDAGLLHLRELTNLTEVSLSGTRISNDGLKTLLGMSHLTKLILANTEVNDYGLVYLKEMKGLSTLWLNNTRVSNIGLSHLKEMSNLCELNLYGTRVGDGGLAHLKGLKKLTMLWLNKTRITDAGLVHLKELSTLRRLGLGSRELSDVGLVHLTGITSLHDLWLAETQVSDVGLKHLQVMTSLRRLWLAQTQVSDAGMVYLKDLIDLSELSLDDTEVSDAGMVYLKELINLRDLSLKRTQVSDVGLANLKKLTNLIRLQIKGTQVTKTGIADLKQALPNLYVGGVS